MPTTGTEWISLATGQILDFASLETDLVDVLRESQAEARADLYGGDATIGGSLLSMTYGTSDLDLDANRVGTTPDGYRIEAKTTDPGWNLVPFADSGATIYHVGARRQLRPSSVTGNTADGGFYYDKQIEDVGELGAPTAVSNQGAGAGLFLDVTASPSSLVGTGWTVAGPRPVVVYLVNPVTASADAIYAGTIAWDGGAGTHRITIPHYLGQDGLAPSTTPADYQVIVQGPTVTTTPLGSTPEYWYLGNVQSGVWDGSAQALVPGWSTWLALFTAEHDVATGWHTQITANGVDLYGAGIGRQVRQELGAHELGTFLASMEQNGGAKQNGGVYLATGAAPYSIRSIAPITGTYCFLEIPFAGPHDQAFEINGIDVGIYMLTAGVGEDFHVELVKRAPITLGISNAVLIAAWQLTKPAPATWENRNTYASGPAFPFTVPKPLAGEQLAWRLRLTEANPAQVQVSRIGISMTANRIEPF